MISSSEAKKIIESSVAAAPIVLLPLVEAAGLTLAKDVYAPLDIPAFPQSSMDGYAFIYEGWLQNTPLQIVGKIAAGSTGAALGNTGHAVRIFTGAALPDGADTVVEQESTRVEQDLLYIEKDDLRQGHHVRPRGSEIKAGALALKAGTVLTPAALGFLSAIGIAEVSVHQKPIISIILTGDELQTPGTALAPGQVYEANSVTLIAALNHCLVQDIHLYKAPDDLEALTLILEKALAKSDMVLLTGGVSVGDYDYVLRAAALCGVEQVFHKIKQKPGKPLYFGVKLDKMVFGLPGNPASVLTCFYQYVLVALSKYAQQDLTLRTLQMPLAVAYTKTVGMTHFLKGYTDGHSVSLSGGQESYRLATFATSNCLIEIPEQESHYPVGHLVKVDLI